MASRCTRRGELDGSGLFVVLRSVSHGTLRGTLWGSVSEVLYPPIYSVKMIADDLLELLINDVLLNLGDV